MPPASGAGPPSPRCADHAPRERMFAWRVTGGSAGQTGPVAARGTSPSRRQRPSGDAASVRQRVLRWSALCLGVFVALSLVTTLVILPVRDVMRQRTEIDDRRAEFEALADANEQLVDDVDYLGSQEGLIASARSELGFLFPGERQVTILEMPALPTALPAEWPYSMVTNIVEVRSSAP